MKKILILGGTGMLGNTVVKHFMNNKNYSVYFSYRNEKIAFDNFDKNKAIKFDSLTDDINNLNTDFDYVINCIGIIKPFMFNNMRDSIFINSIFPWNAAYWCKTNNIKFIHITTDCVFDGLKGKYNELDEHNALDEYGKSKSLGEPRGKCMILRTSIIGEEIHKNASLISWAKSQRGKIVNGFLNHFWNGITTKQYAIICENIIENNLYQEDLFHIHSKDIVSKYQMLEYFNEKYDLNLKIKPYITNPICDRSLSSIKELCFKLDIPTVKEQINNLE
ncbi:sugar nucleotide-binding protein [Brachyspira hampsonii]|uniref:sugar nucleotide-binding protein n=1 Tax=Brachyspira hampsonii TaxID=1287055 RepID=UPI000D33265B|nr:sugar nucleotide-binding protein [Brachyspira hampsonii]PTY40498.1 NAD-dependent dehydratase [Brachyspira hampsonii bv. II]